MVPFWPLKRRKAIERLQPSAPLSVEKLFRFVGTADKSYLVKEGDGWLWTTVRPANDPPRYAAFSGRILGGGPLPLKEMVMETGKLAVENKSIFFLLDVPRTDMIQPDFVWELVQAFANRSNTSKHSDKTFLLAVFLRPQALSVCWPDLADGLLATCSDCSGREAEDAPGIDGIAVVDACHLEARGQRLTVELFFLHGSDRGQLTSIRVRYGGCPEEAINGPPVADGARTALASRMRRQLRQLKADIYVEAFKSLRRTELDCCEHVGRSWLKLIRSVNGVLPLRRITSAVIDSDPANLRCRMMESQMTPRTGSFELTGGELSALNYLRNSHVDVMRIDEPTGIVVSMLADWLRAKDNRTTAANLLVRIPGARSGSLDPSTLSYFLDTILPVTLQLSFDHLHRNFRLLNEAVPSAIRDTRALLDFVMHRRQCPVVLASTDLTGQDADWLVMTLIECFQRQSDLGTFHLPLYVEYVANEPVLLDLDDAAASEKEVEQRPLLFPTPNSETGVYSSATQLLFDVHELLNQAGEAVHLYVSRKPAEIGVEDDYCGDDSMHVGAFKRYVAFIPSRHC